jgi:hypothetical protein
MRKIERRRAGLASGRRRVMTPVIVAASASGGAEFRTVRSKSA